MVMIMRTAAIASGKTGEAIAFANQMAKFFKEKYGVTLELLMPFGGNPNRLAWRSSYESLAQWEALAAKVLTDPEYMGAVASNAATFMPGSVHDEIWRTIS